MSKILKLLSDGRWHAFKEIQHKTKLNDGQIQQIIGFLGRYCFINVDEVASKVMLNKDFREFLGQRSNS